MLLVFIAYLVVVALMCWGYASTITRAVALASLGLVSSPFLIAGAGLAGEASGDAQRLLWTLLGVYAVPPALVGSWRRQREVAS